MQLRRPTVVGSREQAMAGCLFSPWGCAAAPTPASIDSAGRFRPSARSSRSGSGLRPRITDHGCRGRTVRGPAADGSPCSDPTPHRNEAPARGIGRVREFVSGDHCFFEDLRHTILYGILNRSRYLGPVCGELSLRHCQCISKDGAITRFLHDLIYSMFSWRLNFVGVPDGVKRSGKSKAIVNQ